MSLRPEIVLAWGDGEYLFRLNGREIEELQKVCGNIGFGALAERIVRGHWFWGDLYHIVRLGLMGGGMGAVEAKNLTDMYIGRTRGEIPLVAGPNNPATVAVSIIGATMHGWEDLPPGEADAPEA